MVPETPSDLLESGISVWQRALSGSFASQALPLGLDGTPLLLLIPPCDEHLICLLGLIISLWDGTRGSAFTFKCAFLLRSHAQCADDGLISTGAWCAFAVEFRGSWCSGIDTELALLCDTLSSSWYSFLETWAFEVVSGDVGWSLREDVSVATRDELHLGVERVWLWELEVHVVVRHVGAAWRGGCCRGRECRGC